MTQSISGLTSGLDTNAIIKQLVDIERSSQNVVKSRGTKSSVALQTWGMVRETLGTLRTASLGLAHFSDWRKLTASSSDEAAVTVSAGTGTFGGSLEFVVDSLARAGVSRSANTVTGTSTLINADNAIFVAAGGKALGFATFASDSSLTTGDHKITVTQSSEAATKTGGSALAASTVIDGTNNTLNIDVNGSPFTLTIAAGTYSRSELATAIQAAADAAGAPIAATLTNTNELVLSSTREGSAATIQVTGGNSLASLGLTTDGAAITGSDGKVKIDDETEQTVTSIDAGGSIVLNAAAGTVTATFSGGLRDGSITGENVSVGDGSLATVVANINAANAGVSATAVQVAANTYRLQLSARTAGVDNDSNVAASEFGATLGGFVSLTAASDAHLTVGSGEGAYTITSQTNTITGLLPGVTVTLKKETDDPVTITAERDTEAIADSVQSLIDAANEIKAAVDAATKFDPETRKASPLTGDSTIRRLMSAVSRAITDAVPTSPLGSPGLAGVSVDKTGKFTFDRATFIEKFNEDPTGMEELFVQGGTATDSQVSFVSSGDRTRVGTYDVVITQAATQANDVGLEGSWPMGSPPTVRVRIGSKIAEYTVGATDTQQDIVDGLNSAFAAEGLSLEATVSGTGVKVATTAYGTSAKFDVAWDGATYESVAGLDVQGTIDGVTATGSGQNLAIPFDNTQLGGLTLKITATAPGALGSFTYEPGLAQRLSTAILDATDISSGYVTSTEKTLKSRIEFVNRQVDSMESRLVQYEARLKRQYASLEATLGILQQQSQWLAGQIAGLQ